MPKKKHILTAHQPAYLPCLGLLHKIIITFNSNDK